VEKIPLEASPLMAVSALMNPNVAFIKNTQANTASTTSGPLISKLDKSTGSGVSIQEVKMVTSE